MPVGRWVAMHSGAEHLFDVGDASLYRLPHLDPKVPTARSRCRCPRPARGRSACPPSPAAS